jgi:hypothetical protein
MPDTPKSRSDATEDAAHDFDVLSADANAKSSPNGRDGQRDPGVEAKLDEGGEPARSPIQTPEHPAPAPDLPRPSSIGDDDFDLGSIVAPPEPQAPVTKAILTKLVIRNPRKDELVRVRRASEFAVTLLQFKLDDGEAFGDETRNFVHPSLERMFRDEFNRELTRITLRMAVNERGKHFLWPVETLTASGRAQPAAASRRAAVAAAERDWIFIAWKTGEFQVRVLASEADRARIGEPKWPNLTVKEVLKLALSDGKFIDSIDHPIIRKLRTGHD